VTPQRGARRVDTVDWAEGENAIRGLCPSSEPERGSRLRARRLPV